MTAAVKQEKKERGWMGGGGRREELLPSPGELGKKIQAEEPRRDYSGCPGVRS